MSQPVRTTLVWGSALIAIALVLLFSLSPVARAIDVIEGPVAVVGHAAAYLLLTFSLLSALSARLHHRMSRRRLSATVVAAALVTGIGLEALQSLLPAHTPQVRDLVANVAGTILGWAVWETMSRRWPRLFATSRHGRHEGQ